LVGLINVLPTFLRQHHNMELISRALLVQFVQMGVAKVIAAMLWFTVVYRLFTTNATTEHVAQH